MKVLAACVAPVALLALLGSCTAPAPFCRPADNVTEVAGGGACLVIRTFAPAAPAPVLFVVMHGDTSAGGPSTYHYAVAERLMAGGTAVALIRPGYYDEGGRTSAGSNNGRRDNYTAENIGTIAEAVRTLRLHHRAARVVLVGHSGGAAIAGVILGRYPGLADAAVLVSCPCDISRWRATRGGRWRESESPSDWVSQAPSGTQVVALAGSADDNTLPGLSEDYAAALTRRGVMAQYVLIPGAGHNEAFRSPLVVEAALRLGAAPTP